MSEKRVSTPLEDRWINTIVRSNTRSNYTYAFKLYLEYTGKTAEELVDEAIEDQRRDPREKRGLPLTRILGFYEWLQKEYRITQNSAKTLVTAVRSFYSTFEIYVKLKGRSNLPRGRVRHKRLILDPRQVLRLVNHTRTIRDRAIIVMIYQSGMDVSTLCSLEYQDVEKGLRERDHPLFLDMSRVKTEVDYFTFLGRDSADLLEAYIEDMMRRGFKYTPTTSLFWTEHEKRPLRPHAIQDSLRDSSIRAGFIQEDSPFNIAGAHALRESFSSILINDEVPDSIVDFLMGHVVGAMASAYKTVQFDKVRRIYLEREPLLSIYPTSARANGIHLAREDVVE